MKSYLMHHGILGQKWGVRRFQNKDGSLTEAGKARQNMIDAHNKMNELNDKETEAREKWANELSRLQKKEGIDSSDEIQYAKWMNSLGKRDQDYAKTFQKLQKIGKQNSDFLNNVYFNQISDYTIKYGKGFVEYVTKEIKEMDRSGLQSGKYKSRISYI